MLSTRLWMGAILVAGALAVLLVDQWLAPFYPFLMLAMAGLGWVTCREMVGLLGPARRMPSRLCYLAIQGTFLLNGVGQIVAALWPGSVSPWAWLAGAAVATLMAAFLVEMVGFHGPADAVPRMALVWWTVGYLGFLPCFFANLRWLGGMAEPQRGAVALALAMFVPKGCDIGAYFTGRLIGRHRMVPLLSPKKTWEGAGGGLLMAVIVSVVIESIHPLIVGGWVGAIGFGLTVGIAAMLGDLAESLIKRDCQQKDASQAVPGFGGFLDVVDSVIFAAPVVWLWVRG
jgi:phosphatidate cytidylyltransferase